MTVALLLVALTCPTPPVPALRLEWVGETGRAYHYHRYPHPDGLSMRQVANRRGIRIDWQADGLASTRRCDRLGWHVLADLAGRRVVLQVVDCSDPRDLAYQRSIGDVLEVDFSLADALGFAAKSYGGTGSGRARATLLGYAP